MWRKGEQEMKTKNLFRERRNASWQTGLRYFRIIAGSGGTPLFLLLVISLSAYLYTLLLQKLPHDFPVELLLALLVALVVTPCSVRTFIKEPDTVFLLPMESHMKPYFTASLRYSIVIQVITTVFLISLLYPLYRARVGEVDTFLLILVGILLLKAWNIYSYWQSLHYQIGRLLHPYLRFVINFSLAALFFYREMAWWIWLIFLLALTLFTWMDHALSDRNRVPWYLLVEKEEQKRSSYYAIANLFVDVPQVLFRIKRRRVLTWLIDHLPFKQKYSLLYLYLRTFIRHNIYLGIYFRILLVGVILISIIRNPWLVIITYLIALVLNGIQLPSIVSHHQRHIWVQLYPLAKSVKKASFSQLTFGLLTIQSVFMILPLLFQKENILFSLHLFLAGLLLCYGLSYHYLPKKVEIIRG